MKKYICLFNAIKELDFFFIFLQLFYANKQTKQNQTKPNKTK